MSKKLDIGTITNELEGSAFFPPKNHPPRYPPALAETTQPVSQPEQPPKPENSRQSSPLPTLMTKKNQQKKMHDTVVLRHHDTKRDTVISRYHDTMTPTSNPDAEMLEIVRKSVKQVGKEAATQRLTLEEKQALIDIEYTYKSLGVKTSGNEILRIATNYIVYDYKKNGEQSILAKILNLLNS